MAGAWIFYSILPKLPVVKPRFKRIARFAPLIGFFLGTVQAAFWIIFRKFGWPTESLAFLVLGLGALLTGGIHLDGFLDTADGIAAGKVKSLIAMKDSRAGAIGVISLIAIIGVQISALIKLDNLAYFSLPIILYWGRYAPILAIEYFPYIQESGNSNFHKSNWNGLIEESTPSLILLALITLLIYFFTPLDLSTKITLSICNLIGIIPCILICNYLGKKLDGHCGDSYGALVVLVETFLLFIMAIFL